MPTITVDDAHPDNRRIAFTGGSSQTHVWALRNLFPTARATR
jgi:hypothetical protein